MKFKERADAEDALAVARRGTVGGYVDACMEIERQAVTGGPDHRDLLTIMEMSWAARVSAAEKGAQKQDTQRVLGLQQLAKYFSDRGLSQRWLHAEAKSGRLPCFRAGNRLLFNPDAVEQALLDRAAEFPGGEK